MEMNYGYVTLNLNKIIDNDSFELPNFQRGIAWSKKKKQDFVKTLIEGNPFGSILLYRKGKKDTLIDGLQRITTIKEFYHNPYKLIDSSIIDEKLTKELIKKIKTICNNVKKTIPPKQKLEVKKINSLIFKQISEENDAPIITKKILEYLKLDLYQKDEKEIEKTVKEIIKELNKTINIDKLTIHALVYNGSEEKLPDIFYNLNVGGVKPSNYEVLASIWKIIKYKIEDKDFINTVYKRYEEINGQTGLTVTITKDELTKEGISLFEYCYAIGAILLDEENDYIPFLGKRKKNTESIGFELVSLLCGLKVNEANKLDKKLLNATGEFLMDIKNIIIEGFDKIYEALEEWVISEKGTYNNTDSRYMIYHMFMAYIKKNYTIDVSNNEITKIENKRVDNWNEAFKNNLHLYYIKDYISDYWSDNRQVSNLMKLIKDEEQLNKYSIPIKKTEWKPVLEDFKKIQIEESNFGISNRSKMFIDYLIKFKIKENPDLRKRYFKNKKTKEKYSIDIEHIIPQKRIEDIFNNSGHSTKICPISSLGNLCYLTSTVNREKHEKTIYEKNDDRPGYIEDKEFLSFVNYPEKEKINEFLYSNFTDFYKGYIKFINNRIDNLIEEFIDKVI